jgi:hypothetical protein
MKAECRPHSFVDISMTQAVKWSSIRAGPSLLGAIGIRHHSEVKLSHADIQTNIASPKTLNLRKCYQLTILFLILQGIHNSKITRNASSNGLNNPAISVSDPAGNRNPSARSGARQHSDYS